MGCHVIGMMGEVCDPHKYLSPFSSLYSTDVTRVKPLLTLRESLVTSKDGKRNQPVIQPVENMRWDLMDMMSVQLASET